MTTSRSPYDRSDNYRHHGEKMIQLYLEEDILDEEVEAAVEDLYSDGEIWKAIDLIVETVDQERNAADG